MEVTLQDLAKEVGDISRHLEQVDKHLQQVDKHLQQVDKRLESFDGMEARLKHQAQVFKEELKEEVKKGADGYGVTLESIERQLGALNTKFDTKFGDHDLVLTDHNKRITKLEKHR